MKQRSLSPAQLQLLVWTGLMAPAAECFPGFLLETAGRNAWLSVLLGGLLALAVSRLLASCGSCPGRRLKEGLGRGPGLAVLILYIVWIQLLLTLRLGLCADRLLMCGRRDGSRLFFLAVLTLLLLRIALSPLPSFARAAQIFFAALAFAGALVLVLALPACRARRLLPPAMPPLSSVLTAAGVLAWAFPAAFLPTSPEGRYRLRRDLTAVLLLTLSQGILLANLGPGLAGRVDVPFFTMAKTVGVEGAFQRAESAIAALWILSDLTLAGILLQAQKELLRESTGHETGLGLLLLLCAFSGALWGFPDPELSRTLVPAGGLLLALLLPLLIRMTERR